MKSVAHTLRRGLVAASALAWGLAVAAPALAQVIEVFPGGEFAVYSGPIVYRTEGVTPIVAPAQADGRTAPSDISQVIAVAADRNGLNPQLVEAVAWTESRFRQEAVSPKGAVGVMQLMPATARGLGVDSRDLRQNVEGGAAYLRSLLDRYGQDLTLALAAYNAGPGAVDRYGGVPPFAETRAYVQTVISRLDVPAAAPESAPPFVISIDP